MCCVVLWCVLQRLSSRCQDVSPVISDSCSSPAMLNSHDTNCSQATMLSSHDVILSSSSSAAAAAASSVVSSSAAAAAAESSSQSVNDDDTSSVLDQVDVSQQLIIKKLSVCLRLLIVWF